MMHEIGSEFWDVPKIPEQSKLFPESTQWFLAGRSALKAIITEMRDARSVSLPSWCCDSMIKPFVDAGLEVHFYPVYWRNGILIQEIECSCDVLFLIDYFGYAGNERDLKSYKGTVIRDVTHSLFSSQYTDADYYFGSLRKWCGVWTGGFAWAKDDHQLWMQDSDDMGYVFLRERAMQMKNSYIHGWGVTDKEYLKIFEDAEECLEKTGVAPAAFRDVQVINKLDVDFIKAHRRANAEVLRNAFRDWLIFPILSPADTPMFVPILVPDGKRDDLRRFLIKNDIYCPVHWPVSEYHRLDKRTEYIYKNELSLVCDQRYTEEDMNRIVETIKIFMGE